MSWYQLYPRNLCNVHPFLLQLHCISFSLRRDAVSLPPPPPVYDALPVHRTQPRTCTIKSMNGTSTRQPAHRSGRASNKAIPSPARLMQALGAFDWDERTWGVIRLIAWFCSLQTLVACGRNASHARWTVNGETIACGTAGEVGLLFLRA